MARSLFLSVPLVLLGACAGGSDAAESTDSADQDSFVVPEDVPSPEEVQAAADATITHDNADEELKKLEAEIGG